MKKLFTLSLVLLMTLSLSAAAIEIPEELLSLMFGEAEPVELTLAEENMILYPTYGDYTGEYAAIIKNDTDQPARLGRDGKLELLDKDQQVVQTIDIYSSYPTIIPAGGVSYVSGRMMSMTEEDAGRVTSHKFTIAGQALSDYDLIKFTPLTASAEYEQNENPYGDGQGTAHEAALYSTIVNPTDATAFDPSVVNILRDAEGKLILISMDAAYSVGIPAGGKIILRTRVDDGLATLMAQQNTTVASVESIAFIETYE